jgi:DNA-directed RNA polymerase subunit RPC12/RpoP/arsenate reductase-like glutaredoxin family protein
MPVPITHTDGAGMILPNLSKKNFMCRLPWIKGLLAVFDFKKFIEQQNEINPNIKHEIVKDIYGKDHDIFKENIQIIFTKSQFKMYKYYSSWSRYKKNYKRYNCQAGICNLEDDRIKNARINYQIIQTLTNMTEKELIQLAKKSTEKIKNLSSTVESMLKAFGVTKYNTNKTYLQQALEIYPELLRDNYTKDVLREIKKSLIKDYKSSKLEIEGKYTFLIPDMYAFCDFLFNGNKNPCGLLKNNEVYCKLYKNANKLDCLRSPHLFREHAVRNNVIDETKDKWFITDAIYTSCHDLISKVLQFDVDGDRSLVVAEKILVDIAERSMRNIVPLYYDMKKADPVILNNLEIYKGLNAAYTGGNIGAISNDITKIWNSGKINNKKLRAIKLLCMENNFTIDYAKTLYKPVRPKRVNDLITNYTKSKVPYFFKYAKDKEIDQVEKMNNSIVNKLDKIIIDKKMNFSIKRFGKFDYTNLMNNRDAVISSDVIEAYNRENRIYHYKINMEDENKSNISYIAKDIRSKLSKYGYSDIEIADMIIKYLYNDTNSKSKESLWFCYGSIIVNNIKHNLGDNTGLCMKCGKRFKKKKEHHKYCDKCSGYQLIGKKTIKCIDCGKEVEIDPKDTHTIRCTDCNKLHRRELKRLEIKRYRERNKNM